MKYLKRLIKKEIDFYYFKQLIVLQFARWLFKKVHSCNICGNPNVVGYAKGLICQKCTDYLNESKRGKDEQ
jgi:hypothetical protein